MKKKLLLLLSMCFFTIIFWGLNNSTVAFAADSTENSRTTSIDNNIDETQYNNNIKGVQEISLEQFLQKKNNNDKFIIYIGFKECPHCRKFSPVIKKFLKITNTPIYYLDYGPDGSFKSANKTTIQKFFNSFNTPFEFAGTPTVALFSDNNLISMTVGDDTTLNDLQHILNDSRNN